MIRRPTLPTVFLLWNNARLRVIPVLFVIISSLWAGGLIAAGYSWLIWSLASLILVIIAMSYYIPKYRVIANPGWLAPFALLLFYHLRILSLFVFPIDLIGYQQAEFAYTNDILNYVSFVGFVAIAMMLLGYRVGDSLKVVPLRLRDPRKNYFVLFVIVYTIGLGAYLYKADLGFVHYGGVIVLERSAPINQVLSLLTALQWIVYAYIVYTLRACDLSPMKRFTAFAIVVMQLVQSLTQGGLLPPILWAIPLMLVYDYSEKLGLRRYRMQVGRLIILALGGMFLLIVSSYVKEVTRSFLTHYGLPVSLMNIVGNIHLLPTILAETNFREVPLSMLKRFMGADSLAVIVAQIHDGEKEFLSGYGLWLVPVAFVPRLIWPNKPDISLGMWFTDNYWRTPWEVQYAGAGTQGTAFYLPGDFYMNFGLVGVVGGMFVVGWIISYVYKKLAPKKMSGMHMVLLSFLFFKLIISEFSFAGWIAGIVKDVLLFYAFYTLIHKFPRLGLSNKRS